MERETHAPIQWTDLDDLNLLQIIDPELRHANTDLKNFVIVIPKAGLATTSSTRPSFGMTPIVKYNM